MYYIIANNSIVEIVEDMDDDVIQHMANLFGSEVYAIKGEHSGYKAIPDYDTDDDTPGIIADWSMS